jgi:membrane-associated phospholipid phosphatase
LSDPDVERAAYVLADHALRLVGLGVVSAVVLLAAVVVSIRLGRRFRPFLLAAMTRVVARPRRHPVISRALSRSRAVVPGAYLALHLGLGLGAVSAASAFVVLAEATVAGGDVVRFDVAFTQALQAERTSAWDGVFRTISIFGTVPALALVTAVVGGLLILKHDRLLAFGWIAAQAGGGLLNRILKETFDRARPEFADSALAASSWSFPSGHAMGTVILCGVGCYLLARRTRSWTALGVFVTIAPSWCLMMAFSRLYLGVHFASDVVAGAIAGVAWVAVCVSGLEVVRHRTAGSSSV